jgi:hypothetical protein
MELTRETGAILGYIASFVLFGIVLKIVDWWRNRKR